MQRSVYMYVCVHVCKPVGVHMFMYFYVPCTCMYVWRHEFVCAYSTTNQLQHAYVYCLYVHVCICLYAYKWYACMYV